ncbi:MAG: formyltransferase family protein [bacterium]|nr:formyltransferase family protein [bacterium]
MGASLLAKHFNLLGIISEERKGLQSGKTVEDDAIIKAYDQECAEKEKEYFGFASVFPLPEENILHVAYSQATSAEAYKWITDLDPDYIVLFSAGIIREPLLSAYNSRIINLHLGLTPYYRGSGNAFWPMVLGEPEGLGATVHLVVPELDAGNILGQARPEGLQETDGPRDISNKNVVSGLELLVRCIQGYGDGTITPQLQRTDIGRVFRLKEYSAQAILALKENFGNGMIKTYLEHKAERDGRYPIIEK